MTQEQLKTQFLEYAENNLNNETILESIIELLDNISNELYENGNVPEATKLNTALLIIRDEVLREVKWWKDWRDLKN